ncbi:MAG: putative replicase [Cressdnaviricota sp.]|nr:MAG: putative replicase [Cressdnaviricota sp.]
MSNKKGFKPNKPMNEFVKPELLVCNNPYAFTLNPKYQPCFDIIAVKDWYLHFCGLFYHLRDYISTELIVELSSQGRFHFHGTLSVKDNKQFEFYGCVVSKLMDAGTCSMKVIEEETVWLEYVEKQQNFMKPTMLKILKGWFADKTDEMYPMINRYTYNDNEIYIKPKK